MKTFLITGAGHFPGLGSSVAMRLLQQGHNVVMNSRSFDPAWQREIDRHAARIKIVTGDISDRSVQDSMIAAALDSWGQIDGLVNNASTGAPEFHDGRLTNRCWLDNFQINVIAAYDLSESCYPHLKKTHGSIVNVSSRAALQPGVGNNMAYAVSKAAMNHLARNLAFRYAPEVTVNVISPSWMDTQRLQNIMGERYAPASQSFKDTVLIKQFIDPDQVADQILNLLQSRQITGHVFCIDGGASIQPKL